MPKRSIDFSDISELSDKQAPEHASGGDVRP